MEQENPIETNKKKSSMFSKLLIILIILVIFIIGIVVLYLFFKGGEADLTGEYKIKNSSSYNNESGLNNNVGNSETINPLEIESPDYSYEIENAKETWCKEGIALYNSEIENSQEWRAKEIRYYFGEIVCYFEKLGSEINYYAKKNGDIFVVEKDSRGSLRVFPF
jgi:hypothetical protein